MSGITNIVVGDPVPVALQIEDGATDQYPQAEIRDQDGTLLTTLDLSHEASGLYVPASAYNMPDEDFIKITYIVYINVGHTTESSLYQRDADFFVADKSGDIVVDGTITRDQSLKVILAALAGLATGGGGGVITFRDVGDTQNVLQMTVDINGNRSVVLLNP